MSMVTLGTVSWHSSHLIDALLDNVEQTAAAADFTFLVCDNTNGADEELYDLLQHRCQIIALDPEIPDAWRAGSRAASYAHGAALNFLFSKIETEIAIFVDPDVLMLMPAWDQICIEALDTAVATGAPYHARKITKYRTFPSPIFIAFRTAALRQLGPDWTPYQLSPRTELTDQMRRLVSIAGSYTGESVAGSGFYHSRVAKLMRRYLENSSKDTGWRIALNAEEGDCRSKLFSSALQIDQLVEPVRSNRAAITLMQEYELFLWKGAPVMTHFYGSGHRRKGNEDQSLRRWQALAQQVIGT